MHKHRSTNAAAHTDRLSALNIYLFINIREAITRETITITTDVTSKCNITILHTCDMKVCREKNTEQR